MSTRTRNNSDRLRTVWTPEMDRFFIDLMLEEVGKGSRIDDHLFGKRAWKHMTNLFNARFKFQYEKDILKNRHKTLRNLYKFVKNLLDQAGFSWDEMRQMVTADNNIWDEYIKVHPEARSYRIKTIPYYKDLCLIYKNATTDGKGCHFSHDKNMLVSETVGYLEGLNSPLTPVNDGGPGDHVPEFSSHSGGNAAAVTQASDVDEATIEALHDIMIDEDYGISLPKGTVDDALQAIPDVSCAIVGNRTRTYWQPPMDRYFIDLMLDQVQKGNQIDGLFRKQAWMEMVALFNAKFGFKYDVEILKNRYKTLRRQYNVIKNLLGLNGFVWDDMRQMVTADDCVWQDYIKEHTDARQYMTRPIPYYKDLCVICRDLSIDGRECFSGQNLEQEDEGPEIQIGQLKSSQSLAASSSCEDQVGAEEESCHVDLEYVLSDQNHKRPLESLSNSAHPNKLQRKRKDEGMAHAIREMATAVSSLADKRDDEHFNSLSIENVIAAIQTLPDMDEDLVLDACDLLEDEKRAKTFLALDVKLRKKWLMRKLRPNNS